MKKLDERTVEGWLSERAEIRTAFAGDGAFTVKTMEPIEKGWSGDEKYRLTDRNGKAFFFRTAPAEKKEKARGAFLLQEKAAGLGVSAPKPFLFGKGGKTVFSLQEWIGGEDAEKAVASLSREEQYALGHAAGEDLRKLHALPAPPEAPSWETRYGGKIDRKLRMYADCPLKYEDDGAILAYIAENRGLIAGRPQCAQHGDFHIGNMMTDRKRIWLVDFDRFDFGDPWEEYNRVVWSAEASPAFAAGSVDGYFGGEVPDEFWRLLALYIAVNTLSSLPWAVPFGEGEIETMKNQEKKILFWYDGMKKTVPAWYGGEG